MRSINQFNANQVAKLNLLKIAHDRVLGDTNAGWCYMFAPLRSYLTNPDFLQALYNYKQSYCVNGKPTFNIEFLEAFFGIEQKNLRNNKEVADVCDIIHALALSTDKNCCITNSKEIYNLIHRLEKQYKTDSPTIMMNYLATCTAVMNETLDTVLYNSMVEFEKINLYQLQDLEKRLNTGECITVGASGNHIYNVYKNNGSYFVTGTNGLNVEYGNLSSAIMSWKAKLQYNFDTKGKLISIDNPFHGYYTLSKGEIYDEGKRKRINEYYRRQFLTPAERQKEDRVQNEKEHELKMAYDSKWKKEAELNDAMKQKNKSKIAQLNKDIQGCVNRIDDFVFKKVNNNQKLGNLLMDLSGRKNPYIK